MIDRKSSKFASAAWLIGLMAMPLPAKEIRIVTTTTDLKSITEAVGGEHVSVNSIANGKQDPHFIEARPSYMIQLRKADLFIRIGLEMERGWESLVLEGSRNRKIQIGSAGHLDASANIERLEVPVGEVSRAMGDVHPLGNPHYWLDPYNGRKIARTIANTLAAMDPENADDYAANAAAFSRQIDMAMFGGPADESMWQRQLRGELDPGEAGWHALLAPHRGKKVVTYHRSWTYFLARFGLVSAGELESKPGIAPSPGHLKDLIESMNSSDVPVLIAASFKSNKAPNLVADKTGVIIVKVPYSTKGNAAADTYISMIDQVVRQVAAAFNNVEGD